MGITNRPLKFRIWVKSLLPEETGLYYPDYFQLFKDGSVDRVVAKDYKFKSDTCEFTLMQFTGLKDKNDKEIFEGDIVRHPEGIFPVTWYSGCFGIEGRIGAGDWHGFDTISAQTKKIEVIGNCFEHPELLKGFR